MSRAAGVARGGETKKAQRMAKKKRQKRAMAKIIIVESLQRTVSMVGGERDEERLIKGEDRRWC